MGQLNLDVYQRVYLDTAIVIYVVESHVSYSARLQPLWHKFQAGDIELVTSQLTLMETLVKPIKENNQTLVGNYRTFLEGTGIELVAIDKKIILNASQLRATTALKTPDAIHAATAISVHCDLFLTNDRAFENFPGLSSVVILDDII